MKLIKIFTAKDRKYPSYIFKIEEIRNGYSINRIIGSTYVWGNDRLEKIGEAKSLEDAILLAKISVKEPVVDTKIE